MPQRKAAELSQTRRRCFAVVDQWGFLWSGGGTYIKDFGAGIGRQNIVIRMDTETPGNGMQYFPLAHESDVRRTSSYSAPFGIGCSCVGALAHCMPAARTL